MWVACNMRALHHLTRHGLRNIAMLLLSIAVSSCASSNQEKAPQNTPPVAITSAAATPAVATPAAATIPVEAQQQFDKAVATLKAGQTDAATAQLQQLASNYPTFAGPLINLGLIEFQANRYESAANLFKRALERDAKSAAANNYLGMSYRYLGRFKDAEAAYKGAIAADDTYAVAHLNLGVLYDLYLQQPELALPEYERYQALQSTPDAKVAAWIKELTSRLNAAKKAKTAEVTQP